MQLDQRATFCIWAGILSVSDMEYYDPLSSNINENNLWALCGWAVQFLSTAGSSQTQQGRHPASPIKGRVPWGAHLPGHALCIGFTVMPVGPPGRMMLLQVRVNSVPWGCPSYQNSNNLPFSILSLQAQSPGCTQALRPLPPFGVGVGGVTTPVGPGRCGSPIQPPGFSNA